MSICPNCGEEGPHFIPPMGGGVGFYHCKPKGVCMTCKGKGIVESSSSGRTFYGEPDHIPCPTCTVTPAGDHSGLKCEDVIKYLRNEATRDVPDHLPADHIIGMLRAVADYLQEEYISKDDG